MVVTFSRLVSTEGFKIGNGDSTHGSTLRSAAAIVRMDPNFIALLADESPDAAIITTADGTVRYWNRGAESVFGYSSAEAVGESISALIVPEDNVEEHRQILEETLRTGHATVEFL